jgi:hypothetical protein
MSCTFAAFPGRAGHCRPLTRWRAFASVPVGAVIRFPPIRRAPSVHRVPTSGRPRQGWRRRRRGRRRARRAGATAASVRSTSSDSRSAACSPLVIDIGEDSEVTSSSASRSRMSRCSSRGCRCAAQAAWVRYRAVNDLSYRARQLGPAGGGRRRFLGVPRHGGVGGHYARVRIGRRLRAGSPACSRHS